MFEYIMKHKIMAQPDRKIHRMVMREKRKVMVYWCGAKMLLNGESPITSAISPRLQEAFPKLKPARTRLLAAVRGRRLFSPGFIIKSQPVQKRLVYLEQIYFRA
jgi:hypothetical protein